jgi:uncharacterized protein (PEP-CTERM system associated)
MNLPEHKKCRRGLCPAAYFAATAMLLLSSYSYGQVQGQLGQGQFGQGQLGQGMLGQGQPGQPGQLGQAGNVPAQTAEGGWRIRPQMTLIETYTDNVTFARGNSQKSDFITQINPGIWVTGVGRRFNLNAQYTMNNLIYAEQSNFTRTRQQLNATATTELIENLFFVDGRATMSQQNTTLFGPQAIDNVNVTGNRTDVRSFNVSPYIRHRFQDFATTELRYSRNIVSSSSNALFNSQADAFLAGLNSGTAFNTLSWGLNYSNQTVHFSGSSRSVELERSIANVRYMVTRQFGLTAMGGYERNSFISIRGNPSSPTWMVGFVWEPSERTNIAVSGGQRFYGNTYAGSVSHRTRMTVWNASYNESITTFNQQAGLGSSTALGSSLGQLLAAQNPTFSPDIIQQNSNALLGLGFSGSIFSPNNFLTNRLFLQKTLQASVAMNGIRNTVVFRIFNMSRRAFSPDSVDANLVGTANLALLNNTKQSGANLLWSYRISELTSANLNLAFTRFNFLSTDRVDDFKLVNLSLTRQLPQIRPNLNSMIQFRHQERASNQPGGGYSENAIIASLNMSY